MVPNPPSREVIAAEIRGLLGKRRMSQAGLAEQIGMSRASLSARLNGSQAFTVEQLEQAAAALDVDVIDLLGIAGAA
jgi:transcriptional regulator with XRE-family HTH domain